MESKTYGQILDERYVNEDDSSGGGGSSSMGVATLTYTIGDEYGDTLNSVSLENLMTLSEYLAAHDGEVFMEQAVIDSIHPEGSVELSEHIIGNHIFAPYGDVAYVESLDYVYNLLEYSPQGASKFPYSSTLYRFCYTDSDPTNWQGYGG